MRYSFRHKTQEWAAERFKGVQYPEMPRGEIPVYRAKKHWFTIATDWLVFGIFMWMIWGGVIIAAIVIIAVLLHP